MSDAAPAFDADWIDAAGGNRADLPFWEAWREGRFTLHRCATCGRCYWPASCCVDHGGAAMAWVDSPGAGVVHSWTRFHRHYSPADHHLPLPYNVVVIRLDEGLFFHSRVIDCAPDALRSGLRVVLAQPRPGELPLFRPAPSA